MGIVLVITETNDKFSRSLTSRLFFHNEGFQLRPVMRVCGAPNLTRKLFKWVCFYRLQRNHLTLPNRKVDFMYRENSEITYAKEKGVS